MKIKKRKKEKKKKKDYYEQYIRSQEIKNDHKIKVIPCTHTGSQLKMRYRYKKLLFEIFKGTFEVTYLKELCKTVILL